MMNRINNTLKKDDGFTLIEIAVLILVLSFILVPLFNFLYQQRLQRERIETEAVNERLLAAMAVFIKNNGRYPCPANHLLDPGDANFGRENCYGGAPTGVMQGDVPTYDLGIPYRLMYNTDFYKYIYAVNRDETVAGGADNDGVGTIQIVDSAGAVIQNQLPFVIVNIGQDGKGNVKQTANGNINNNSCNPPGGSTAKDSENCDNDNVFRDMAYSVRTDIDDADYYDDSIFYGLAREESTFWITHRNATNSGIDIINRNSGTVNVGDYMAPVMPDDKFIVNGGNVKLDQGDLKAEGQVGAPVFYYK